MGEVPKPRKLNLFLNRTLSLSQLLIIGSIGLVIVALFQLVGSQTQITAANSIRERAYAQGYGDYKAIAPAESFRDAAPRPARSSNYPATAAIPARPGGPNVAQEVLENVSGGAIAKSALADRRIIYTATVELVTENIDLIEPKLVEMIKATGGFVADTNQTGASGGQRFGTWKVRVPVDKYDGFLQQVRSLGEVQSVNVNSQDVTEEFVDVSARVGAKKVQEQRLIDLIKNAVGNLEEVLKVEAELARVRSEIERFEGRIRFLKDQTELTTITISVREVKDYKPPEAPTFNTKMRRVWEESTLKLWENSGLVILDLIAWAPFLPVYIVILGAGIWLAVRVWRKILPMLDPVIELKQPADPDTDASAQSPTPSKT